MPNQTDKATPRPWIVSHTISQPIITDGHKCLAEIVNDEISNVISRAEAEANAALIVKCVNEHEALNSVAEAARKFEKSVSAITHASDHLPGEKQRNYISTGLNLKSALANLETLRSGKAVGK